MNNTDKLKSRVVAEVDARRDELIHISDTIHANPALVDAAWEEHRACFG
jgi:hypothetical protein